MKRIIGLIFTTFLTSPLFAQQSPERLGAYLAPSVTAHSIHASDGTYDKFVLIRWEPDERAKSYRLFRANSAEGASMFELTKTWQNSTWFCDYSAEKGKEYYYAVMNWDGQRASPLSTFDKGYVSKGDKYANGEAIGMNDNERFAAQKMVIVLVEKASVDKESYRAGEQVQLSISLRNLFDEPSARTEVRIYLSADTTWDFDDNLLLGKTFSGFPAESAALLHESLILPGTLLSGDYYLIIVASGEGNILNAKTGFCKITVTGQ